MLRSHSSHNLPEQAIPTRVVIGVTGHRKLDSQPWLIAQIQTAIETVRQMVLSSSSTPVVLTIISPLAEGADRLVVREVLKFPGAMLDVVLPLEKDDYEHDFETTESKQEFEELLSQAISIQVLSSTSSRTEAYEQVGRYIADHCDVLIALWNGKPAAGRGGTQEIVQYARNTCCPLIWIHTEEPENMKVELGHGLRKGHLSISTSVMQGKC